MNAKGGVGKSSLVLTLAETLSAHHAKRVLVIDSDAHASISTMLISPEWLATIQGQSRTLVDYLIALVLKTEPAELAHVRHYRRFRRGRCALDRSDAGRRPSDAVRARGFEERAGGLAAAGRSRLPGRGAPGLRPHPDRQRPRPVGADRVLAARGGFLPVAGQARLPLDACPAVSPAVRAARCRDGVLREPGRRHQHEGRLLGGGRAVRPLAAPSPQGPLLRADHPARGRAADGRLFQRPAALLLGKVPRPDRPHAAPARQRIPGPPVGGASAPSPPTIKAAMPRRAATSASRIRGGRRLNT